MKELKQFAIAIISFAFLTVFSCNNDQTNNQSTSIPGDTDSLNKTAPADEMGVHNDTSNTSGKGATSTANDSVVRIGGSSTSTGDSISRPK